MIYKYEKKRDKKLVKKALRRVKRRLRNNRIKPDIKCPYCKKRAWETQSGWGTGSVSDEWFSTFRCNNCGFTFSPTHD